MDVEMPSRVWPTHLAEEHGWLVSWYSMMWCLMEGEQREHVLIVAGCVGGADYG